MVASTYAELTPMQQRILTFLAQADAWQSRQDMYKFVGTTKGYSVALGAPTGMHHPNSLEALALVERQGNFRFKYRLSSSGRLVVAKAGQGRANPTSRLARTIDVETSALSADALESAIERGELSFPSAVSTGESTAARRARRGQAALRRIIMRNYGRCCAVCDVTESGLLRASHIARWADCPNARGKLANVICLCVFHDALFEQGYWMLSDELCPMKGRKSKSATVSAMLPSALAFKRPARHPPSVQYVRQHRARHGGAEQ